MLNININEKFIEKKYVFINFLSDILDFFGIINLFGILLVFFGFLVILRFLFFLL